MNNDVTYTWKLTGMKANDDGAIFQTYWNFTGTHKDGREGTFPGATPFDVSKLDTKKMIQYENLTEETVLEWIQNEVNSNETYKAHIEQKVQEQINSQAAKETTVENFPWLPQSKDELK